MKIPIEISARHVHISQKDRAKLFGKNYQLRVFKVLSQPSDFASKQKVELKSKSWTIKNVRVLGPERNKTQVEVSYTDARKLGLKGVLRLSGDHSATPGITLVGPKGRVVLKSGVIVAKRHIHASDKIAKKLKLRNKQKVKIRVAGDRAVTFEQVIVRVAPEFKWHCHVDTDEGNAADISSSPRGEVII